MKLSEFIQKYNIRINKLTVISANPNMYHDPSDKKGIAWEKSARHYLVELYGMDQPYPNDKIHKIMLTYFSTGSGWNTSKDHNPTYAVWKKPVIMDVFPCLVSDAQAGEMNPFEFISEFGYDNPRVANRVYDACVAGSKALWDFLGEAAYKEAMECEIDD